MSKKQFPINAKFIFLVVLLSLFFAATPPQAYPELTLQEIFKKNAPAVVFIGIGDADGKLISFGSGFLVSPSGVMVTNHHVIAPKPGGRVQVKLANGDVYDDVWVIHDDERRDFAVLLIKASGLPVVKLGDSDKIEVGEQVVAIGHPQGLEMTFTAGFVSALRPFPDKGYRFIQHQTPISGGSSGGPLLNMNGEVVGINTFSFKEGQNLNGAVAVNYVKAYLSDPPKMTYKEYARLQGAIPPEATWQPPVAPLVWKTYRNQKYGMAFKYPGWGDGTEEKETPDEEIMWIFEFHVGCSYTDVSTYFSDPSKICQGSLSVRVWSPFTHEYWLKKEADRIDFQATAKNHHEKFFRLGLIPSTRIYAMKFLDGQGYGGYYVIYDNFPPGTKIAENLFSNTDSIESDIYIFTKTFMYELSLIYAYGADLSQCTTIADQILSSFTFSK